MAGLARTASRTDLAVVGRIGSLVDLVVQSLEVQAATDDFASLDSSPVGELQGRSD